MASQSSGPERVTYDLGFGKVTIQIGALARLDETLAERAERLKDLRPLWYRCVEDFQRVEHDWFGSEGKGSWPELAESTVKRRTQKLRKRRSGEEYFGGSGRPERHYALPSGEGPTHQILQWTHRLRESFESALAPGAVVEIERDGLTYGSSGPPGWPEALYNDKGRPMLDSDTLRQVAIRNGQEFLTAVMTGQPFSGGRP